MDNRRFTRAVLIVIAITLLMRIFLAAFTGLGYGESYYSLNALHPQLSYFDQPPLAFWLATVSMKIFGEMTPLSLRLPSIICFAVTTWLMFAITKNLFSARAGFFASLILNLSMVFTATTATWLQPDSVLMTGWLATAFCLTKILFPVNPLLASASNETNFSQKNFGAGEAKIETKYVSADLLRASRDAWKWWILAGIFLGVTTLAKYHAIFLFAGAGLFALTLPRCRRWVFHPAPYVAAIIGLLIACPVLIWNAEHSWASFVFQGERAAASGKFSLHFPWLIQSIGGQALWLLPWIWLPLVWQLARAAKRGRDDSRYWFLFCTAILPIIFFTVVTLWSKLGFHFHWQAPGYLMLFPLLGDAVAECWQNGTSSTDLTVKKRRKWIRLWLISSAVCCLFFAVILQLHAATGFWTFYGPKYWAAKFDEDDPTLEGFDYDALRDYCRDRGYLDNPQIFMAVNRWYDAGKAGWALRGEKPLLVLNNDPRNPAFLYPQKDLLGKDAIFMAHYVDDAAARRLTENVFAKVERLPDLQIVRGGVVELTFPMYYCRQMVKEFRYPDNYRRALGENE